MSLSDLICKTGQAVRAKHERRKEARPGELLDAALDLFVAKGFAATRAEEVAAKAGVSKGTLFLYFKSKEELFEAVVRENISNQITQGAAEIEAFTGSTAELLRYAMFEWWNRVGNTKASGIIKLVMAEASNFPNIASFYQEEVIKPAHQLIRGILQRGIDRGEFRTLNMDYAVYSVIAPLIFLTLWKHSIGPCSAGVPLNPEDFINSQSDIVVRGILTSSNALVDPPSLPPSLPPSPSSSPT